MTPKYFPPEWAFEFHGHQCPFMPLGYRMGILAMEKMGLEREKDHTLHIIAELGVGHPQSCLMDGMQAATGATFGKALIEKTFWGKLAATFWYPGKMPVRYALKASFLDDFGKFEFFAFRKRGIEPSEIPDNVTKEVIDWTFSLADDEVFDIRELPDLVYTPVKGSFNRTKCSVCGEYVFDRYIRMKDGKPICIPCSGYMNPALRET